MRDTSGWKQERYHIQVHGALPKCPIRGFTIRQEEQNLQAIYKSNSYREQPGTRHFKHIAV